MKEKKRTRYSDDGMVFRAQAGRCKERQRKNQGSPDMHDLMQVSLCVYVSIA